jgi:hypothetical protein
MCTVTGSDAVYAHVDADIHLALVHQIYGTPTFVINGFKAENLDQTTTFGQWINYIDALLNTTAVPAVGPMIATN